MLSISFWSMEAFLLSNFGQLQFLKDIRMIEVWLLKFSKQVVLKQWKLRPTTLKRINSKSSPTSAEIDKN
ncbi:hypothetical protein FRX31_027616 [Thalictrum thalictroides]|uniref:Uncharacterized protein n=1 Tax=Thalictrum thalictroides TaxID=46969 RepID=A0A7J6VCG6_THATH|nr:hypothetical protein FRX31_027616 [Thalictrum thalictroides]